MADLRIQIPQLPTANTVAPTDYLHIRTATQDRKITWEDLIGVHEQDNSNPHNVTKTQIGLSDVDNVPVLNKTLNLADVPDKAQARVNLGVPSLSQLSTAIPSGVIMMWSGSVASIPSGFALCNGSNGTPNLSGKFIVCTDNGASYPVGGTGGRADNNHTHTTTIGSHKLAWDEIPPHKHNSGWGEISGASFGIDSRYSRNRLGSGGADYDNYFFLTDKTIFNPDNNSQYQNDAKGHSHSATIGSAALDNRPPYYALAFIMKL